MSDALQFFTPCEGRFIVGDLANKRTQRKNGGVLEKIAPEKQQIELGVAFPKNDIWALLSDQLWPYASQVYASNPDAMQRLQRWFQQPGLNARHGGLSLKIWDGDVPNSEGKTNENAQGCFVFQFTSFGQGDTSVPPKVVAGPDVNRLSEIGLDQIKCGDYVAVSGSFNPNGKSGDQIGMYLNANIVWKLRDGPAISTGADPSQAFAGANLSGSFDPTFGAGAAFGAPPVPTSAPAPNPTVGAPAPSAPAQAPYSAPPQTASAPPTTPHTGITQPPTTPPLPTT